jgi:arylsulfatase A-like enzyme
VACGLAWMVWHPRRHPTPPDILVIVIDSLRADHLGSYGYSRATTPFLDGWAARAGLFSEAYTHGTQTRIAMSSLFTGTLPTLHRVRNVRVVRGNGRSDAVAPRLVTWAESLREVGYETWGYSSNVNVSAMFGFAQGFTRWTQQPSDDAAIMAGEFLKRWRERAAGNPGTPLFVYLHFNGVHSPYFAPPPYDIAFPTPPGRRVFASYHHDVTPADLAFSMAQYDGSILYTDRVLSDLIPAWESAPGGRPRATLVLADHGEEFLDHGSLGHGSTVYRELAHVPLLVKAPGVRTGRHDEPVGHADVHRLVLDLAGAAVPEIARGRPYAAWTTAEPTLYTESSDGITGLRWRWRLLARPLDHRGRAVLFDDRTDPRELTPLDDRAQIRELQKRMDTIVAADARVAEALGTPGHTQLDSETTERLRALGYVDQP